MNQSQIGVNISNKVNNKETSDMISENREIVSIDSSEYQEFVQYKKKKELKKTKEKSIIVNARFSEREKELMEKIIKEDPEYKTISDLVRKAVRRYTYYLDCASLMDPSKKKLRTLDHYYRLFKDFMEMLDLWPEYLNAGEFIKILNVRNRSSQDKEDESDLEKELVSFRNSLIEELFKSNSIYHKVKDLTEKLKEQKEFLTE